MDLVPTSAGRLSARTTRLLSALVFVLAVVLIIALLLLAGDDDAARLYSSRGLQLRSVAVINGPGTGDKPGFERPLGVAVASDGTIFVADTGNDRICAFDRSGRFLREWGGFGIAKPVQGATATWKPGRLNFPAGIDVGDDGLVYVADFHNDQISVFEPDGTFVRAFPDPAKPVGRGSSGQDGLGIAVTDVCARDGYVYATDAYQVFVFTAEGGLVRQFGRPGAGLLDIDHPAGIVVTDEAILVSDSNHTRITAFTLLGEPLWTRARWSESDAQGTSDVGFGLPRGLTVTAAHRVVVADAVGQDLVVLSENGSVLASLGERGTQAGQFNFPADVDSLGATLVVADKENDRVQVFQLTGNVDSATAAGAGGGGDR